MSIRKRRQQIDVQTIVAVCMGDENCPFKDFQMKDDLFTYKYSAKSGFTRKTRYFRINFSSDYPDFTTVSSSSAENGPYTTETYSERIPIIFNKISSELYRDMKVPCHNVSPDELPDEDSGCSDDMADDDDYAGYYDDDDCLDDDIETEESHAHESHPFLTKDISNVHAKYGSHVLTTRVLQDIDIVDADLHVPVQFLEEDVAKAWGAKYDTPITVRLQISLSQYMNGVTPTVKVFQAEHEKKTGIICQLKKIVEQFVLTMFKHHNNSTLEGRMNNIPSTNKQESSSPEMLDLSVTKFVNMGFEAHVARNALIIAKDDEDRALELLLGGDLSAAPGPSCSGGARPKHGPPSRQNSSCWSLILKDLQDAEKKFNKTNAKHVPDIENGFLFQVLQYLIQRLPTLNEYCVICDNPHIFQNGAMLKPSVCARELCVFSFQTLGVMGDATEAIATDAEVVDLLVRMAVAAAKCPSTARRKLVFNPYPTVVDPEKPDALSFNPKVPDFKKVEETLDAIPSISSTCDCTRLKRNLNALNKLAYPLLQWIINSNRSHIVKLQSSKQLSFMRTAHQFLLVSSPPAKEAKFREHRARYKSCFAFHGSKIENWHSIMRNGLYNATGTELQSNGAAYGKGVYLSPLNSVSFGYSSMSHLGASLSKSNKYKSGGASASVAGKSKKTPSMKGDLMCVALCEVINSPDLKKATDSIWVMPDENLVATRFFFIYDSKSDVSNQPTVDTRHKEIVDKIKTAIKFNYYK